MKIVCRFEKARSLVERIEKKKKKEWWNTISRNWRVNCLWKIGQLLGYFQGDDNDNETKRRWRRILDRRILREPCSENESRVDANVIIVREKSWLVAAVVQSNHAIRSQDFHPSVVTDVYESTWTLLCRMCHETLKRKGKFFPKIPRFWRFREESRHKNLPISPVSYLSNVQRFFVIIWFHLR